MVGLVAAPEFLRSGTDAANIRAEVLPLIHEAGNPYYDWFFGKSSSARSALETLFASPASEISAGRVTLLVAEKRLLGMYVALPGAEVARCRLADALVLLGRTGEEGERRTLSTRIDAARGLFPQISPHEYFLSKIGVVPSYRRRGLGAILLDHYLDDGLEAGYQRFRLDVPATNAHAIRLYRSRGFEAMNERRLAHMSYVGMVLDSAGDET